jgi:hypothetical protein
LAGAPARKPRQADGFVSRNSRSLWENYGLCGKSARLASPPLFHSSALTVLVPPTVIPFKTRPSPEFLSPPQLRRICRARRSQSRLPPPCWTRSFRRGEDVRSAYTLAAIMHACPASASGKGAPPRDWVMLCRDCEFPRAKGYFRSTFRSMFSACNSEVMRRRAHSLGGVPTSRIMRKSTVLRERRRSQQH